MSVQDLIQHLLKLDEELVKDRPLYEKAKAGLTPVPIEQVRDAVNKFNAGDSGEKAIFIVAQVQFLLKDYHDAMKFVTQYERKQAQAEHLRKTLPIEK